MFTIFKANIKVAAFGRHRKRGGAAEGRVTSFVVAATGRHLCILALDKVNVFAVTAILILHVGAFGHHAPCHYDFMLPMISDLL